MAAFNMDLKDPATWLIAPLVAPLLPVAAFFSCDDGGAAAGDCVEGETQQCYCSASEVGAQVCEADGTWGPCDCSGTDSDTDVDTDTDTDVDTDSDTDVDADTDTETDTDTDTEVDTCPDGYLGGVIGLSAGGGDCLVNPCYQGHTCALLAPGGAKCWGRNLSGQLGDGTGDDSSVPVDVWGLTSGVDDISSGYFHTCAATTAGGVKCWGSNDYGQLGNGTFVDSLIPVDVSDLSSGDWSVSSGGDHTCAVVSTGGVWCWGQNNHGQLGDGTTTDSSVPVEVDDLFTMFAESVSAGENHSCMAFDGSVRCWGNNAGGQLGDGTTDDSLSPVGVVGLSSVEVIDCGAFYTCALTTAGAVKCWGWNEYGQLGNGTYVDSSTPVDVVGLSSGVQSISIGHDVACAVMNSGAVNCWGDNVGSTPVEFEVLSSGVQDITIGPFHACALMDSGGVKCWGQNYWGQLGDGTTDDSTVPVDVVCGE